MIASREYFYVSSLFKYNWKHFNSHVRLFSSQAERQPKLVTEGPWQIYSEKLSNGTLSRDEHQEKVVQQLQHIYQELVAFERPVLQNPSSSSIFSFFRKSEPQKIIAPKGLYIYGSVGGGKTMLMDLFYETVPVSPIIFISVDFCLYLPYCNSGLMFLDKRKAESTFQLFYAEYPCQNS